MCVTTPNGVKDLGDLAHSEKFTARGAGTQPFYPLAGSANERSSAIVAKETIQKALRERKLILVGNTSCVV
jgi:hypothetical protein